MKSIQKQKNFLKKVSELTNLIENSIKQVKFFLIRGF